MSDNLPRLSRLPRNLAQWNVPRVVVLSPLHEGAHAEPAGELVVSAGSHTGLQGCLLSNNRHPHTLVVISRPTEDRTLGNTIHRSGAWAQPRPGTPDVAGECSVAVSCGVLSSWWLRQRTHARPVGEAIRFLPRHHPTTAVARLSSSTARSPCRGSTKRRTTCDETSPSRP